MTVGAGARVVGYYRVSTDRQGRSGLGIEAQREAVARYAAGNRAEIIAEFTEVESGRTSDRPQLAAALSECRARSGTLVIARLDRLARDAHFLLGLAKAGVEFVAADMPHANRLTVGIMAVVAEEEARLISARTKAALAAAKARGVLLGNPQLRAGTADLARAAAAGWSAKCATRADQAIPYVEAARRAGAATLREIAEALTSRGVCTPGGRSTVWHPEQVRRLLMR